MTTESEVHNCCSTPGVARTTDEHVRKLPDGRFEARCGFALMGATNMNEAEFKACNYDPFHEQFRDNYALGTGATEAEALDALRTDLRSMSDSLFAV